MKDIPKEDNRTSYEIVWLKKGRTDTKLLSGMWLKKQIHLTSADVVADALVFGSVTATT